MPFLPQLLLYMFIGKPIMFLISSAFYENIFRGIVAVVNDYARPIVLGKTAARMAIPAAYVLSILLFAGLLHFNTNDVGLTRAFEMFFSL